MKLTFLLTTTLACLGKLCAAFSCCGPAPDQDYHKEMIDLYFQAWNGDYSQLNSTFDPSIHIYLDRILTANGSMSYSVQSRSEVVGFMLQAREGWDKYEFEPVRWTDGDGYSVAVRWKLNGIIGAHFSKKTTLAEGAPVTYNGTDFLQIDKCSGLIKQVDIAQDYITLYHALGDTDIRI